MQIVGERLLETLDEIVLSPSLIAEIGGGGCPLLAAKYAGAKMLALDFAMPVLRRAAAEAGDDGNSPGNSPGDSPGDGSGNSPGNDAGQLKNRILRVQADAERLPLMGGCADLAYSNLCLEWTNPAATVREAARILRAGGVFVFSTLGPDTLREMRLAFGARVHDFADMHDIGDLLAGCGFAEPVMQREEIVLTYSRPADAAAEVHRWGAGCAKAGRAGGLTGKNKWRKMLAAYPQTRGGGCAATYEIIYATAFRKEEGGKDGDEGLSPLRFFRRM